MDLLNILSGKQSKAATLSIVQWVGTSQKRFDELFDLFTGPDLRLAQLSGTALSNCVMQHPGFIKRHWTKLLTNLERPDLHGAITRNTVRLLQYTSIPEAYQGIVMVLCFKLASAPAEKPAVKAFSLTILDKLSKLYPEIRNELKLMIRSQWDEEGPAFRSRGKKILAID